MTVSRSITQTNAPVVSSSRIFDSFVSLCVTRSGSRPAARSSTMREPRSCRAVRKAISSAAEDEPDAERVDFRADMFRAYAEGFVEGTAGALTDREIAMLPDGAYIITLEQAIRFLTDYLEGDVYYHTAYADHNLVRTRTQIRMLMGMERDEAILRRAVAELRQHRAMHG